MKYDCKFCNGKGKQSNGLSCISCKGKGFFEATGKVEQCPSCKGSGRAAIRALQCIRCRGKGFFLIESTKDVTESKIKTQQSFQQPEIKTPLKQESEITKIMKRKNIKRKIMPKEEFGEEHLDKLGERLTEIMDSGL